MDKKKFRKFEQYPDMIGKFHDDRIKSHGHTDIFQRAENVLATTVTFQVTDTCNLNCSYCYQVNKGKRKMSIETAKKFVDFLLNTDESCDYINPIKYPAIVVEFIGGEPFLEVELISEICKYFELKALELNHPWAMQHMFSICSNGTLGNDPKVKQFLSQYGDRLSYSVTIDGNKELHDACRVFYDGSPSYDLAIQSAKAWMDAGGTMGSKITIAPENIIYLHDAILHMIDLGYNEINANCVYEEGWDLPHAVELYQQMKKISDYILENDLEKDIFCSLYNENYFHPKDENEITNWCGGTGMMLSCDPDGHLYPCIRYMESSLGESVSPMRIGHIDTGIGVKECEKSNITCLNCINRRTQSTDECFNCPIAEGCSWCSAYNYQEFGTPDKRATYICVMHKARAVANAYHYGLYYQKTGERIHTIHIPDEWAIPIVGKSEWDMIKSLYQERS